MRKFILPILAFLVFLNFSKYSYAQDSNIPIDCLEQRHEAEYQCGQIHKACVNRCSGPKIDECISACFDEQYKCDDAAKVVYDTCFNEQNPDKSSASSPQSTQPQSGQSTEKPSEFKAWTGEKIPVFIGEWFQAAVTGMIMEEFAYEMKNFAKEALFGRDDREIAEEEKAKEESRRKEWEQKEKQAQIDFEELMNRAPLLTDEELASIKRNSQNTAAPSENSNSPYGLDILRGDAQIKLPGQNEWKALKAGDQITPGSTIFTGMDATTVLSIEGKGVVEVQPFTEIIVDEKGLEQAAKTGQTYTDIKLNLGEIEVNIDSGVFTAPILQISTPNSTTSVRGTHFWVSYDKDKRLTALGVYEGKVEFTTTGGKKITVLPDGEKQGVVVVSQKFSPTKLALGGLLLAAVFGGIVWLLKRKFVSKGSIKRRK